MTQTFRTSDRQLAARIEAAEALNVVHLAKCAAGALAETAYEPIAGGYAVFAGLQSPMTHALGIGMTGEVSTAEMERLETFYFSRGSATLIDLCPLADPSVIGWVQSRPYRVIEFNNVLVRQLAEADAARDREAASAPGVRPIRGDELRAWARLVAEGFAEGLPVSEEMVDMLAATCGGAQCWIAGEAEALGGAAMGKIDDVALFVGDAVSLPARRQGWQQRLIAARVAAARQQGCSLAVVSVLPGSGSQRNYERAGFELLYMRVNVMRKMPAGDR